jgi:hypothetical protein
LPAFTPTISSKIQKDSSLAGSFSVTIERNHVERRGSKLEPPHCIEDLPINDEILFHFVILACRGRQAQGCKKKVVEVKSRVQKASESM